MRVAPSVFVRALALGLATMTISRAGAADGAPLVAALECESASEAGRVRCSLEAHAANGRELRWADVVIVSLPEFGAALKGRLGKGDTVARDSARVKWAFGLIAKRAGRGEVRARVRAVTCDAPPADAPPLAPPTHCVPSTLDVTTTLVVGG